MLNVYSMDDDFFSMSLLEDLKSQDKDTALAAFRRLKLYWNLGLGVISAVVALTFTFSIISPQRLVDCLRDYRFSSGRVTCR